MLDYTVYEPPVPASEVDERAEALVFVRDGFEFSAFVFGPLWLLAHRLWLGFVLYVVAAMIVVGLLGLLPGSEGAAGAVWLLGALVFGFEANSIRRWTLERNGYHPAGVVTGRSFEECEHRFLSRWLAGQASKATPGEHPLPPVVSLA